MRKVEFIMGMPITVDIPEFRSQNPMGPVAQGNPPPLLASLRGGGVPSFRATQGGFEVQVFEEVFKRFREIDNRFSSYIRDSELSKYQRGEIGEKDLSAEFKKVVKACKEAEKFTDGYFSAYFSGKYDPTGYVKGWAIAEAGKIIEKHGIKTYCIGAGGDILARSNMDKVWNVGIQDPKNKQEIINMLSIANGAVATSGNYERGAHIINPKTGKLADKFLSATATGPDIIMTDILATAVFAAGNSELIKKYPNYKVFVV
jgi:thiamine biosynthesis lipoprotein